MIKRAEALASTLHEGQLRRDGTPFIHHCEAVYNLLRDIGVSNPHILAAAWLHDSLEECDISKAYLAHLFDDYLASIVAALTRDVSPAEYINRIRNSPYEVKIIKIADTLHNCKCLDSGLRPGTISRKCFDCSEAIFELAEELSPYYALLLREYLRPYMKKNNEKPHISPTLKNHQLP
ncbi:MAG: HD domain-containing protein [Candidatus Woesearchaeota archaeon]